MSELFVITTMTRTHDRQDQTGKEGGLRKGKQYVQEKKCVGEKEVMVKCYCLKITK